MSKKRRKSDNKQLNLFDYIKQLQEQKEITEGALNVRDPLRRVLSQALKDCPLSRYQVAGEMSHLTGVTITRWMLDAWTAESKNNHRIPAEYVPAFCEATKSRLPISIINEAAGIFALPGPDALRSEIQKWDEKEKTARAEKRKRQIFLREIEGLDAGSGPA